MTPFQWFIVVVCALYMGRDAYLLIDRIVRRRKAFNLALAALRGAEAHVERLTEERPS